MLLNIQVVQKYWLHFDICIQNIFLFIVIGKKNVVISAIKLFCICAQLFRRRTHRGGRRKQHVIKIVITGFQIFTCLYTRIDRCNLINVHSISNSTKTISSLCVGCLNVQSMLQNCKKRTEITTFICDQHMDILFITETWLKPHGD